ncbi:MAG: nucleotidyltransferase domain-containing protein [Roseomonas sp.]|jgi:predicted nucleotidyltransferase|nr:nucleotidyltransferase domain-containing protein [Roseomonas sp.]
MHPEILRHKDAVAELCRRFGVTRLEVFGSAARGEDFDPSRSDVDLLVEFGRELAFAEYTSFWDGLESAFGRKVDLINRKFLLRSRNWIRRDAILADARPFFAAEHAPAT